VTSVRTESRKQLINPVSNLEDYICQKHERPLELFCRDDQTCVCPMCDVTDHRNHNTVPIEEESEEKKVEVPDKLILNGSYHEESHVL